MNKLFSLLILFSITPFYVLSQTDVLELEKRATIKKAVDERIQEFLYILEEIAERSEASFSKEENKRVARSYFTTNAKIETSSLSRTSISKATVYEYLGSFETLPYDRIELILHHSSTTDVKEVRENVYRLSGLYKQTFRGYIGGQNQPIYADITWKEIEVAVTERTNPYLESSIYDIQFNYIKVIETLPDR